MLTPATLIRVSHCFEFSAQTLYDSWLDPASAARWLFSTLDFRLPEVTMDVRIGGKFQITQGKLQLQGQFHLLERPHQLLFSLSNGRSQPEADFIRLQFSPHPFGCELTVTHQLPLLEPSRQQQLIEHWTNILMRLAAELNEQHHHPTRTVDQRGTKALQAVSQERQIAI